MSDFGSTTPIHLERGDGKGLAAGTLGLWGSTVIGLASTAPVYSLVATLGFVVLAVGAQAPIAFIIAFVPMLFTAFAYRELNNKIPDCGTTFTWGTKAFGPWVGWMGGWGVAIAGMVVLANLAQIGSIYFWALFGMELENNDWRIILVAVLFIASMTWVSWRGVEIGERIQNVLLGVQYLALAIFVVAALWEFFAGNAPAPTPFDWNWLNPFAFTDYHGFTEAVLLALFIYWGWDTTATVNEESANPTEQPGRASIVATVILVLTYVLVTIAAQAWAGVTRLAEAGENDIFAIMAREVMGSPWDKLLILAVLSSAAASTQTTILPTARTALSMGAKGALPRMWAKVHPTFQTPTNATIWMGILSVLFYVGLKAVSENLYWDALAALGLMIAFYYGLTGFAAPLFYRHQLFHGWRPFLLIGVVPLLGGLALTWAFVKSAADLADPANSYSGVDWFGISVPLAITLISFVIGLGLMLAWWVVRPDFFRRRPETFGDDRPVVPPAATIAPLGGTASHGG